MSMDDDSIREFEELKKQIEELKVRRLGELREKERLESELAELKAKIKEVYGVEIEDFDAAIQTLKAELSETMAKLKQKLQECKSKME